MTAGHRVFKAIVADTSPFIIKGGWFPSNLFLTLAPFQTDNQILLVCRVPVLAVISLTQKETSDNIFLSFSDILSYY